MLAVKGTYKNGKVLIREKVKTEKSVNVIVTFLEEVKTPALKNLILAGSRLKSQEAAGRLQGIAK